MTISRFTTRFLAVITALALVCACPGLATGSAWADEVDDAQAVLDAAEARMESLSAEYEWLSAQVADLQAQVDQAAADALAAQEEVLAGRAALGETAASEYRGGSSVSLLTVVLESSNFTDLLRNMEYVGQIMQYQADEVQAQKERKERLDAIAADLNEKKNAQEKALADLEQKRVEATNVVAEASDRLADAKAEQAERLAALERQAAELERAQSQAEAPVVDNATTTDRDEVIPDSTPVKPNPDTSAPGGSSGSGSGSSGGGSSAGGWLTGVASAYGGSSDKTTPNPGTTANGSVCDDWSMGVAIPLSMPNCRSYLGRTVEISYNGMTVYATVNDLGGMGGGSRKLDLQPGVFKAFGFSTCQEWGLRTVSYRFL